MLRRAPILRVAILSILITQVILFSRLGSPVITQSTPIDSNTLSATAAPTSDIVSAVPTPTTGIITTVVGSGNSGSDGDGGPATVARLHSPSSVAVDHLGNIFVLDAANNVVREVFASTGIITTIVGLTPGASICATPSVVDPLGDGCPATQASLNVGAYNGGDLSIDNSGNLYIADTQNNRIRKVMADPNGSITSSSIITTVAGDGNPFFNSNDLGDGGPATDAHLAHPFSIAVDQVGNIFIDDTDHLRVREVIAQTGIIQNVAGSGPVGQIAYGGDGGPATSARLSQVRGIAVDDFDNVYIGDQRYNRVREVIASTGIITTVAGTGNAGYSGDGGPATDAMIDFSYGGGMSLDRAGNLFMADTLNNRVREIIASTGVITTIAGGGIPCAAAVDSVGDGCAPTDARLGRPTTIRLNDSGTLDIADTGNNLVRSIAKVGYHGAPPCLVRCGPTRSVPTIGAGTQYDIDPVQSIPFITGTQDIGNHCNNCSTHITLPFTSTLYGKMYNAANVTSNGQVDFSGATDTSYENDGFLPDARTGDAMFPYWNALRTDTTQPDGNLSGIYTSVSGAAPHRSFTIEWRATLYDTGYPADVELRLYEGDAHFDAIYGPIGEQDANTGQPGTIGDPDPGNEAIGIQSGNGSYTQYDGNRPGRGALRFTPSDQPPLPMSAVQEGRLTAPVAPATPGGSTSDPTVDASNARALARARTIYIAPSASQASFADGSSGAYGVAGNFVTSNYFNRSTADKTKRCLPGANACGDNGALRLPVVYDKLHGSLIRFGLTMNCDFENYVKGHDGDGLANSYQWWNWNDKRVDKGVLTQGYFLIHEALKRHVIPIVEILPDIQNGRICDKGYETDKSPNALTDMWYLEAFSLIDSMPNWTDLPQGQTGIYFEIGNEVDLSANVSDGRSQRHTYWSDYPEFFALAAQGIRDAISLRNYNKEPLSWMLNYRVVTAGMARPTAHSGCNDVIPDGTPQGTNLGENIQKARRAIAAAQQAGITNDHLGVAIHPYHYNSGDPNNPAGLAAWIHYYSTKSYQVVYDKTTKRYSYQEKVNGPAGPYGSLCGSLEATLNLWTNDKSFHSIPVLITEINWHDKAPNHDKKAPTPDMESRVNQGDRSLRNVKGIPDYIPGYNYYTEAAASYLVDLFSVLNNQYGLDTIDTSSVGLRVLWYKGADDGQAPYAIYNRGGSVKYLPTPISCILTNNGSRIDLKTYSQAYVTLIADSCRQYSQRHASLVHGPPSPP